VAFITRSDENGNRSAGVLKAGTGGSYRCQSGRSVKRRPTLSLTIGLEHESGWIIFLQYANPLGLLPGNRSRSGIHDQLVCLGTLPSIWRSQGVSEHALLLIPIGFAGILRQISAGGQTCSDPADFLYIIYQAGWPTSVVPPLRSSWVLAAMTEFPVHRSAKSQDA